MQRPNFRHPPPPGGVGPRPGGFRSPGAGFDSGRTGMFPPPPPPPWAFSKGPPPSFGPRHGHFCGSPNTPPREFYGSNGNGSGSASGGGSGGKSRFQSPSPGHTPRRRQTASPRFTPPYKKAPYHSQSPGHHTGYHQGSPRTSTPFGSTRDRERLANDVEKYYSPSMLQDPWASLQPVAVTDINPKCSSEHATHTGRKGRYFN
ncbi:M-phase-specific PLK1-interacting protein-like [Scleropages formosus]|uniref:M-phase specific PLK1 interacting protein n=1 Tax=Scleropages formosus TaxID=113540 RepID=A0A0P7UHX4_SCLFO|nr:M-phase-specific PLK1-interacting protein [Scleropages formosus]KPP60750.1 M-phase-specific PLK1-interacting protein-like [Scleropages formosus]